MKQFLLLVVTLGLPFFIFSQTGTLNGIVTDDTGSPLYNVNVVIDAAKGQATTTNFDGYYSLELPEGNYSVLFKYIGSKNKTLQVSIESGKKSTLNATLESTDQQISEVNVSATKRGLSVEREVVSIESLSPEILENNNITNGAEAIDRVVGVTVMDGQASIRGGSGYAYGTGSRVILVIDGIPLLSPERSEVLWDFIPMENVRQIDVVKGASSVQYGSAALNGILNVETKWAQDSTETEVTLFNSFFTNPPIEEGKWWNKSTDFFDAPHDIGIQAVHRRKLKKQQDLVVGGTLQSNQTVIQDQSISKIRNNIKYRIRPEKVEGLTVGVNSNIFFRKKSAFFIWDNELEGAYQGESFNDDYVRMTIDPYVKYFINEKNAINLINRVYYDKRLNSGYYSTSIYNDLQYQRFYNFPTNEISGSAFFGLVNNQNTIKAPSFEEASDEGLGVFGLNNFAVYGQSDFTYKRLSLAAGARFDFITLDKETKASKPIFNGGASYKIKDDNYVRFSFGQSFRIPSIAERFVFEEITSVRLTDDIVIPVYAGPNGEIRPESGFTFELGYKRMIKKENWQGSFDAVVFYQDFNDMVEFVFSFDNYNPFTDENYVGFSSQNIAEARIFGWELSTNHQFKLGPFPISFQAGYTYNYPANANENSELAKFGNVVKQSFQAFSISDDEYADFAADDQNPDNILFGMLEYRYRHTLKMDFNIEYKKFTLGTNLRYYSFIDRITPEFIQFISGIEEYRETKNLRGDFVWDLRTFYTVNEHFSLGIIAKNVLNRNYQLRPAKPDAPRTITVQGKITF